MVKQNQSQSTSNKTPSAKERQTTANTDAAKEAKRLLDIISEAKHVSVALSEFKNKRSNILTMGDVRELELLIEALEYIEDKGRQQTTKVRYYRPKKRPNTPVTIKIKTT